MQLPNAIDQAIFQMSKLMTKKVLWLLLLPMSLLFTGCPDYSHLREAPDYKNMTDSGGEANDASESESEK